MSPPSSAPSRRQRECGAVPGDVPQPSRRQDSKPVRAMVIADREQLMKVIDTPALPDGIKARAKAILEGSGTLTDRDVEFLKQTS